MASGGMSRGSLWTAGVVAAPTPAFAGETLAVHNAARGGAA